MGTAEGDPLFCCLPRVPVLGTEEPVEIPGVDGVSRALKVPLHPGKAVLDGAGISVPAVSSCFPQVSLLLELFCGFYYLRVKNALGLVECAAIPKQTNCVQRKVKFPIIIFP